jgi:hypothetical protein
MPNDLQAINAYTRAKVAHLLQAQCTVVGDRNCGGFLIDDSRFADSRNSIYEGCTLFVAYCCPDFPEWYGRPEMLKRLELLVGFMQRRQRANGTVTLGSSAAPGCAEIGFTLPGVCASYRALVASGLPGGERILPILAAYLQRGAEACRTLRPHTANHRWTACAGPLACVDRLFPHPGNAACIADLLDDGLDCDADGFWYEERSPGYSNVANWGMFYLADHFGAKHCLQAAYRNARNILRFIQPSGEADTTFSHRQDRGQAGKDWGDWWVCKRLAVDFNDGELAQAADELLARLDTTWTPFIPLRFLLDEAKYCTEQVPRRPLPTGACFQASEQPIWRWRKDAVAATVVADKGGHFWDVTYGRWGASPRNNMVMSLHHGQAVIDGIKLTWGAGSGGFRPERIVHGADGAMELEYRDPGQDHVAHYRPRQKWNWANLPYDQRVGLRIERIGDGFRLRFVVSGEADVQICLQLLLRTSGHLLGPDGREVLMMEGGRTFSEGGDWCLVGGDRRAWRIRGLPPSEHHCFTGDGSHIAGIAERRCHRLIGGLFSPCSPVVEIQPESR